MSRDKDLHDRIKLALQSYAMDQGGKLNHAEIGKAIARAEGRNEPYDADTVFAWMNGDDVPIFRTLTAIAKLVGWSDDEHQFGYLAYGSELSIHGLSEEDYDRFHRRNSSKTSKRAP